MQGESLAELWVNFLLEETESKRSESTENSTAVPAAGENAVPGTNIASKGIAERLGANTPPQQILIRPPTLQIQNNTSDSSNLYTSAFSLTPESPHMG